MQVTTVEIDSKVNELFSKTYVTQKIENNSENPIELKIYVYKSENCIFSSFSSKIGDSIFVKSKVIIKEKAEEKYTDAISSGNAAIFVSDNSSNENRIIINMGNIPAKQEITFISEFIQSTKSSEFELFRNLPILVGKDTIYQDSSIKGKVEIKTRNKINHIEKKILSEKLNIIEEKYLDEEKKNNYFMKYEYNNITNLDKHDLSYTRNSKIYEYIPSSKIYFDIETKEPLIFSQKSIKDKNEKAYIINYRNINKNEDLKLYPALFIFLIDQSGSMSGDPIKVASKALLLFLQSLPAGSIYQIIGFGSTYKKYDEEPKEYNQENINKSIKLIEGMKADLGGTDIYEPLKDIYESSKVYDKIKLPKNIFLLTDGEIENKNDTLSLIEKNNHKFSIYSIGIGNYFDQDLIKNAGILGKGNYNFCNDIKGLNEIIATEISMATYPFIFNFNLKTPLDEINLYKINNNSNCIKINENINFGFIINDDKDSKDKDNISDSKINIEVKYNDYKDNEEKSENYLIEPIEISDGEELFKLIINNYILNSSANDAEKKKLALKYQIFSKYTSLFAEIELSEKINEEMKQKIIGNKENNQIKISELNCYDDMLNDIAQNLLKIKTNSKLMEKELKYQGASMEYPDLGLECNFKSKSQPKSNFGFFKSIADSIKGFFSFGNKNEEKCSSKEDFIYDNENYDFEINKNEIFKESYIDNNENDNNKEENNKLNENKIEEKINLDNKESIMKIINTQDFITGCWDINDKTMIVKEKYEKEFGLLKNLKNKNIDDKIAMTIIIIYFINKEHAELLNELVMIIKKGKIFIHDKTKETYEYFIEEIGLCN